MKAQLTVLLLFCAALAPLSAQAQTAPSGIVVCVNDNGVREYKNTGATRGCKPVDLQGVSMITAPPQRIAPAAAASAKAGTARPASSPAEFPRVDGNTQKARDNDRMQILSEELKAEEKKLAALRQEYNNGEPERRGDERNYAKYQERVASMKEDLARSEKNVEALKREIANLK